MKGPRAWVAEFIGTYTFFTLGMASIVLVSSGAADYGTLGIAAAHGLGLAIMVTAFMEISGAQFNPVVTMTVWITRRMRDVDALGYIGAQILAGIAAAATVRAWFDEAAWSISQAGLPAIGAGVSNGRAILIEAILTFFLVTTVWGTGIDERGRKVGGLAIGLIVFVDIVAGGSLTGAAMNPARFLGPAILSGELGEWWIYISGSVIGGLAALVYPMLFMDAPSQAKPKAKAPARKSKAPARKSKAKAKAKSTRKA